jgi:hypothetical protein
MYADRLLLSNGKIAELGSPANVLTPTEAAYGCRLMVDESSFGGVPRVTLVPRSGFSRMPACRVFAGARTLTRSDSRQSAAGAALNLRRSCDDESGWPFCCSRC